MDMGLATIKMSMIFTVTIDSFFLKSLMAHSKKVLDVSLYSKSDDRVRNQRAKKSK